MRKRRVSTGEQIGEQKSSTLVVVSKEIYKRKTHSGVLPQEVHHVEPKGGKCCSQNVTPNIHINIPLVSRWIRPERLGDVPIMFR